MSSTLIMQAVNLLNMKTLSERLAFAIKESGISQSELARRVGVTRGAVSLWLKTPDGEITASNNSKAANALGVDANWLATGRGSHIRKVGDVETDPVPAAQQWPFASIPEEQVRALPPGDLKALEGALALAIAQLKLKIQPSVQVPTSPEPRKSLASVEDVEEPFPYIPSKPMPWDIPAEPRVRPAPHESLRISTVANVGHVAHAGYSANDQEFLPVPELDVRLAAGKLGIENYFETAIGEILLRKSFLESFGLPLERMKIVYAEGDSMEPVIRNQGPMLFYEDLVSDPREIDPRTIYAINHAGKMVVKCLWRGRDGIWMARSLNPEHRDFPLSSEDGSEVRIVGRILWSPYDLRNGVDERLVKR